MRYLSVCSGIEAASVAWEPLGWTPVAFAEIDPFACAVLKHRFPHVPNLGDFTKIEAADVGPVELLVGGTPCQGFSVAGKRLGLDDPRSNLALHFCLLARRLRPRWVVWENVVGVHSSWSGAPDGEALAPGECWEGDEGSDFGAFLDTLEECGYSACWRVLDAQYVRVDSHPRAVPQRRERVFLVGYSGADGRGDWRPPAAVLLEPESLRRDSPPRRKAGQDVAGSLGAGSARSGGRVGRREAAANHLIGFSCKDHGADAQTGSAPTLRAMGHDKTHANAGGQIAIAFGGFDASEDGSGRGTPIIPILEVGKGSASRGAGPNGSGIGRDGDPMFTLQAGAQHAIAFDAGAHKGWAPQDVNASEDLGLTLNRRNIQAASVGTSVRRLTPLECERLQGFPDGWTDVPYRGRKAADGPRYKGLGNSMAVPCMAWIGQRIEMVERYRWRESA